MEMENVFEPEQIFDKSDVDEDDDEIYEKIEAPKYVDFTRPDQFLPDDRFWFCSRIGCDQNHEDVDPDALHKSFVLRVMAARSPNVRLRKALRCREVPSAYMKCPQSAPAKPSKPRVCRFTAMTSVSQGTANAKMKITPVTKCILTPKEKPKGSSSAAKALTTPRVKKCIPSSDHFRSVQSEKTTDKVLKSKIVSKALVFSSPPKSDGNISSLTSETPLTEICDGMKKLVLNSQIKKSSRFSSISSRCTASSSKMARTASDPLTSKLHAQLNSSVKPFEDGTDEGVKSVKFSKSASTKRLRKPSCPRPHSMANSDMEIDGESRNGSLGVCSVTSNEGDGNKEQSLSVLTSPEVTAIEQCLPCLEVVEGSKYSSVTSQSNNEKLSEEEGIEVNKVDGNGGTIEAKVLEKRDDSAGVTNATAKSLVFNTPKESEMRKALLVSETPLTEICDRLKKLEINSQRRKPSLNSKKLLRGTTDPKKTRTAFDPSTSEQSSQKLRSLPKKTRTASDPSTSEQYPQKLRSRVKDSEASEEHGNKSLKFMKSTSTKYSRKFSNPQLHSIAHTDPENDGETSNVPILGTSRNSDSNRNEEQSELLRTTVRITLTTQEECVQSLETSSSLIVENVQSVNADFSSCPNAISLSDPVSEEGFPQSLQILNGVGGGVEEPSRGGTKVLPNQANCSTGVATANEEEYLAAETCLIGENLQTVHEVASKHRSVEDGLVCQSSHSAALESELTDSDDKENVATSNENSGRNSNHYNQQSQRNILQLEDTKNHHKVISSQGKALKGTSVVTSTSSHLGKYKKTKPTNPKPFRLRTDERGILREANLEKRHQPAPLKETVLVSHNSDGCAQRRQTIEQKIKSHGQHRQESTSQEGHQLTSDKQIQKNQTEQKRVAFKTSKCLVEPKISTNPTQAHKKVDGGIEKETQKREQRPTKSQLLRQQIIKTQSWGTGSRKAMFPSRRLSIILESSSTSSRSKDANSRNKGTCTISNSGRSSTRVKKPVTAPKAPNFHRVHTPKRCTKKVIEVVHTPKSCRGPSTEATAS